MKILYWIVTSTRTMAILLAVFFFSIAAATFIENDFGSATAQKLVYHAKWFEIVLFLGMINLIGVTFRKKLYNRLPVFLFHMAFILIIMGAGITRYFGFEGAIAIREGERSNTAITDKKYITIEAGNKENKNMLIRPVLFGTIGKNKFKANLHIGDQDIKIRMTGYLPSADIMLEPDKNGSPIAEIIFQGWNPLILKQGESGKIGNLAFSFDSPDSDDVKLTVIENTLYFRAPFPVSVTSMTDQSVRIEEKDSLHIFYPRQVYRFGNDLAVLKSFLPAARVAAVPADPGKENSTEALHFELSSSSETTDLYVFSNNENPTVASSAAINGNNIRITYGRKRVILPFSIRLDDFILNRYPGSNSPSWFESRVTVTDAGHGKTFRQRIYMNHILKYRGYRFYQASYDPDEKGTVLSINYDWAGTIVTYGGYLIMALGMFSSLVQKKSRFRILAKEAGKIRNAKKLLVSMAIVIAGSVIPAHASANDIPVVKKEHADAFGGLLVQDNNGRIEPLNTLSSEILRKIARRTSYKGMTSDQVLLSIMLDPGTWQNEPIVKVSHDRIRKIIGIKGKYAPFVRFFSKIDGSYLLSEYVNEANKKKPVYRSKFDNEVIRTDERLNVLYMAYTEAFLKIFPKPRDPVHKWYSPVTMRGEFPPGDTIFVYHILPYYLETVRNSMKNGDWKEADNLLGVMKSFQRKFAGDVYPPELKTRLEIFYNNAGILERLSSVYGITGFILLLIQFTGIFWFRLPLKIPVKIASVIIILAFSAHTAALAIRWYVSGHAPWSNGYEALTYIAWATVLAGILFSARSPVTLSATSILAFLILNTAHLSWMDPEITNLVPVLKSYWLIIHVAIITSSYGFLGLGALLAGINLIIMFLETKRNKGRICLIINELTNILEMTLIVGLYLLATGTFLGGVWANESWGRYWGWDPKETWALATVIVYAFILHMRIVPGLKGIFGFNLAALLGFGSVIMTYFGVNFYLSGLHSYAAGDPLPVPAFLYYSLIVITVVASLAYVNHHRLNKNVKM